MEYSPLYTLLIVFIGCTIFFKVLFSSILRKEILEKRLAKYTFQEVTAHTKEQKKANKQPLIKKTAAKLERAMKLSKYNTLLNQSGVNLTQGELFIGRVLVSVTLISVGCLYSLHFILLIVLGIIGFFLPILYVKQRRKKRLQKCSDQLGEALGTMANSLRAGFSFMQAMKMVAKEIEDPLGPEFLKTIEDINFGVKMEDAFERLAKRLPDKELEIILQTLLVQRTSGGNLAYLLETMQETIIDRTRVKGEVKTLTAQGKMSSVIITLLPIALALYLKLVNPEYLGMLVSHPIGWIMVAIGTLNLALGWFFIKKIVHIEV